ncbi:AP-3 complex subunit beta-1 [Collichthys lucidus]|uniref:AP-3 complex subunit beta-1 n=1 Tax=Collichthys lucidus TaxID=240159 RepID=A0A4U5VAS9_COLLU|nr:AP-3 complex subunit beta-1 [Collichthys lucidus]
MSTSALYNDQGGAETGVEAGQESTPTSSSTGAAFGLFSSDFKNETPGHMFAYLQAKLEGQEESTRA